MVNKKKNKNIPVQKIQARFLLAMAEGIAMGFIDYHHPHWSEKEKMEYFINTYGDLELKLKERIKKENNLKNK